MKVIRTLMIASLLAGLGAAPAHAAAPTAAPAAAPAKGAFQRDLLGVFSDAQKKSIDLLEAFLQNKLDWRPAPGVRSVAEVFLHIAFGNYAMVQLTTGKAPPAEVGFEMNPAKWDKKTKDKAEIKKILETSYAHVHAAVGALPDADLDKMVNFFGHDLTTRAVFIILNGHLNEHLGQAIAYARSNKVVPPWSKDEHHMPEKK